MARKRERRQDEKQDSPFVRVGQQESNTHIDPVPVPSEKHDKRRDLSIFPPPNREGQRDKDKAWPKEVFSHHPTL